MVEVDHRIKKDEIIAIADFRKQHGLLPAIIQEEGTGNILILGYMNEEALKRTLQEKRVYFYSRARQKVAMKGEESGNVLEVTGVNLDCDNDTLLVTVVLNGICACHTGTRSCFNHEVEI